MSVCVISDSSGNPAVIEVNAAAVTDKQRCCPESCECVNPNYYTSSPSNAAAGEYVQTTVPAGTSMMSSGSCKGGATSKSLICWVYDPPPTCECLDPANVYWTSTAGLTGVFNTMTVSVGAAIQTSTDCGGGVTTSTLVCYVQDTSQICECVSANYYTSAPSTTGYIQTTLPAGTPLQSSCVSTGTSSLQSAIVCWVADTGATCECLEPANTYWTSTTGLTGVFNTMTVAAGAAIQTSTDCGGGVTASTLVCYVQDTSQICECVSSIYYTSAPSTTGYKQTTLSAGTPLQSSCVSTGTSSLQSSIVCWEADGNIDTCECLEPANTYWTSTTGLTGVFNTMTVAAGAAIQTSTACGGGVTTAAITCYVQDMNQTCECVGANYYTSAPSSSGYKQTTLAAGTPLQSSCVSTGTSSLQSAIVCWEDDGNTDTCECLDPANTYWTSTTGLTGVFNTMTVPAGAAIQNTSSCGGGKTTAALVCYVQDMGQTCECVSSNYYTSAPSSSGYKQTTLSAGTALQSSCVSTGTSSLQSAIVCWEIDGSAGSCECLSPANTYWTSTTGLTGVFNTMTVPAGAALESSGTCGGGKTNAALVCYVQDTGQTCECVSANYYTSAPSSSGYKKTTLSAGTALQSSCVSTGTSSLQSAIVCWEADGGATCECLTPSGVYWTSTAGLTGVFNTMTVAAGATIQTGTCGGGQTTAAITCYVQDTGQTCECVGSNYYTSAPSTTGYIQTTLPAGTALQSSCVSTGTSSLTSSIVCWIVDPGPNCECLAPSGSYWTSTAGLTGVYNTMTVAAGAAIQAGTCGGGQTNVAITCYVQDTGQTCECVNTTYYTNQPATGAYKQQTIPAGTALLSSCVSTGTSSLQQAITCWVPDTGATCECLSPANTYWTSTTGLTGVYNTMTVAAGAAIQTGTCGGGNTTAAITCYVQAGGQTCECVSSNYYTSAPSTTGYVQTTLSAGTALQSSCQTVGSSSLTSSIVCWVFDLGTPGDCTHWNYSTSDTGGCTKITIAKDTTIAGAGGVQYYMPQTTDCWSCSACASYGAYDIASNAPCSNPRTLTANGNITCYHCHAVCSDLGGTWTDQALTGYTSSQYTAGQTAGGYTFAVDTTCYQDPGCSCSTCTQVNGGTYHTCSDGTTCEYLSAWCGDWGYDSSSNPAAGWTCTSTNIAAGECASNGAWAPYGLSCWSCTYSSTPFAPLGSGGELVFIGLEIEENDGSIKNTEETLEEFAPLGIDGAYVYTGPLNF